MKNEKENIKFENKVEKASKAGRKRKVIKWVTISLCACVALGVAHVLINPASTQKAETYCGFEEHEHTDECYAKVLVCDLDESASGHVHTEECWEEQPVLLCGLEETDGHKHSDECYETVTFLSCNREETEGHTHGEACYSYVRTLICENTDEFHEHTEECFVTEKILICELEECEPHHHEDSCYSSITSTVCGLEECEPHHHDENCYTTERVLTCELKECEPHQHSDFCYQIDYDTLVCELPEHVHTLQCFSNPEADVESDYTWEQSFAGVEFTGNWRQDVLAIAASQLGYEESTDNYVVQEDGVTIKGYTRYGDWYGDTYGDWCAMFCSFCIDYANVDRSLMPLESGCTRWVDALSLLRMFHSPEEYSPRPGDLIFFDWDETDAADPGSRKADHVGLVAEIVYERNTNVIRKIKTIEGNNSNKVERFEYEANDSRILGYGEMPTNPVLLQGELNAVPECDCGVDNPEHLEWHADSCSRKDHVRELCENNEAVELADIYSALPKDVQAFMLTWLGWNDLDKVEALQALLTARPMEKTAADGEATVAVAGYFSVGTEASIEKVSEEDAKLVEEYIAETVEIAEDPISAGAVDISLQQDGEAVEPDEAVSVTLGGIDLGGNSAENLIVHVYHVKDTNVSDVAELAEAQPEVEELPAMILADGSIVFETEGFSIFYYTVEFYHEENMYVLQGEGSILLSRLFSELQLSRSAAEAVSVTFSDETLLRVEQLEGDWNLVSLAPFSTEETLTILFSDNTQLILKVTDAQAVTSVADGDVIILKELLDGVKYVTSTVSTEKSNCLHMSSSESNAVELTVSVENGKNYLKNGDDYLCLDADNEQSFFSSDSSKTRVYMEYITDGSDSYWVLRNGDDYLKYRRSSNAVAGNDGRDPSGDAYRKATAWSALSKSGDGDDTNPIPAKGSVSGVQTDQLVVGDWYIIYGVYSSDGYALNAGGITGLKTATSEKLKTISTSGGTVTYEGTEDVVWQWTGTGFVNRKGQDLCLGIDYTGDAYGNYNWQSKLWLGTGVSNSDKVQYNSTHRIIYNQQDSKYNKLYMHAWEANVEGVTENSLGPVEQNARPIYLAKVTDYGTEDPGQDPIGPDDPDFVQKAPDHAKFIDAFRDDADNPDTDLDDMARDGELDDAVIEDLYRLYLTLGPESAYKGIDVLIVMDRSNSMMENTDAVDIGGHTVVRGNAINSMLNGLGADNGANYAGNGYNNATTIEEDGLLALIYKLNDKNKAAVIYFNKTADVATYNNNGTNSDYNWGSPNRAMSYSSYGNGTNYMEALDLAGDMFDLVMGDGNEKILLFLSDGKPTQRTVWNGSQKSYDPWSPREDVPEVESATRDAIDAFKAEYCSDPTDPNNVTIFSVLMCDKKENALLARMASSGSYMTSSDFTTLLQHLDSRITKRTGHYSKLKVEDTLSDYVNFYCGDETKAADNKYLDLVVDMYNPTAARSATNPVILYKDGKITTDGADIIQSVSIDFTDKDVSVEFKPTYKEEGGWQYRIHFNVQTTQQAYDEYASNIANGKTSGYMDGTTAVVGDDNTDYLGNSTSSNNPGFHSNEQATLYYNQALIYDERDDESVNYAHPVIQVLKDKLTITKTWSDGADKHADGSVTMDVYQKAMPSTHKATDPLPDDVCTDGTLYTTVTLSAENNWKVTLEDIPRGYFYYVVERAVTGLDSSYVAMYSPTAVASTHDKEGAAQFTIAVTNKEKRNYLVLKKTDLMGDPLKGAEFKLYSDEAHATEVHAGELVTSDRKGVFTPDEFQLENGTYYLVETVTPDGFNTLTDHVKLVVSSDGITAYYGSNPMTLTTDTSEDGCTVTYTLAIPNTNGYELPKTGGIGTTIFYVVGGILIVGAAVLLMTKKRMHK